MKIAIDIRNIGKQRTGSEVVVLELTKRLLTLDRENDYLLLTDTDNSEVLANIRRDLNLKDKKNFQLLSLKAKNKFVWSAWTMPKFFLKNKVDIFHTEYILPLFIPKKTKVVTHIHDVSFKVYREFILKKDLIFLDILIPRSIKRSDKIIAVSRFTKDEIVKYYKIEPEKIEVVFNSINLEQETVSDEHRQKIIEKYALPEKFILYLGTLQPRKNIPTLIEAYAKIRSRIPEVKLVLAGNPQAHNFDQKISEAVKRNNLEKEVFFIGYVDTPDKAIVYQATEVFVFPSFYEGFGIPVLEAISQEVAVLVSDIGPHREILGEGNFYFPPGEVDILADKLYTVCVNQDEQKRLSRAGLERVNLFSWEKSAQQMLNIFNSFNQKNSL